MKKGFYFKIAVLAATIAGIALFIFLFSDSKVSSEEHSLSRGKNEAAISSGLDNAFAYISSNTKFPTFRCTEDLSDCFRLKNSAFFKASVLQILSEIDEEYFSSIIKKGVSEILAMQSEYFLWDFSGQTDSSRPHFFPDLDTTSLSAYFLTLRGVDFHFKEIKETILNKQIEDGVFLTYLREFQPPLSNSMNKDAIVNANVLVLLGEEIPSVCEYINDNFDKSLYYKDDAAIFYMLAKAYSRGCNCIKPSVDKLYDKLKVSDVYSSTMHLSMFITGCFLSDKIEKPIMEKAIGSLLAKEQKPPFKETFFSYQNPDRHNFFYNFVFSAAVYAEALTKIKAYLTEPDKNR